MHATDVLAKSVDVTVSDEVDRWISAAEKDQIAFGASEHIDERSPLPERRARKAPHSRERSLDVSSNPTVTAIETHSN